MWKVRTAVVLAAVVTGGAQPGAGERESLRGRTPGLQEDGPAETTPPAPPAGDEPFDRPVDEAVDTPSTRTGDDGFSIAWSATPGPGPPELVTWLATYRASMPPVRGAWERMLRRLRGDLPARFAPQCEALVASLLGLDRGALLPVPEPLLDLRFQQMLHHLDAAGVACERRELFNVVYRLDAARRARAKLRRLLELRGLPAGLHSGRPAAPTEPP